MQILITGGSGFLGARLARTLLSQTSFSLTGEPASTLSRLWLTDRVQASADLLADPRVKSVEGDLSELIAQRALPLHEVDAVVHLAAAVSAECEADLDLGLRSNLQASLDLLQGLRQRAQPALFVFASSVAVFGAPPGMRLPPTISDAHLPTPQSSYGSQKFMVEQLVADFHRRGVIRGRNVRLMTVAIRPGRPNGAASSFLSGMLREPLAGQRCVVPVPADTPVALSSPQRTIEGLMLALSASDATWGPPTAVNLPALSTTVGDMAQTLANLAGDDTAQLLDWVPDARITQIVGGWPAHIEANRAQNMGLKADANMAAIVQAYAADHPEALSAPLKNTHP